MAWADYYLKDYKAPKKDLKPWESTLFMILALINVVCELIIALIFFALWMFFNQLIKDP